MSKRSEYIKEGRAPGQPGQLAESPLDRFNIELVSGDDFESLEQAQRSTYAFLPKLIAEAVLEGLKNGRFKIVDNRVVVCDTIEQNAR